MDLDVHAFSLKAALDSCVDLFIPAAKRKNLALDLRIADSSPDFLMGDVTRVRQIITNLLSNAVKFTERGSVTISTEYDAAQPLLSVRVVDSGVGMTSEQLKSIFEPFTQGDKTTTRKYGGTGLGLTIARRLAQSMHGDIYVSSKPGEGSAFILELPLQRALEDVGGASAATSSAEATETKNNGLPAGLRLLIAEDNALNQKLFRVMFEKLGYEPTIVDNGAKAVDLLEKSDFDIILMDIQMPIMDGRAATEAIRKKFSPTKPWIIAITAHAEERERDLCIKIGMNDYLTKPLRREALLKALQRAVSQPVAS